MRPEELYRYYPQVYHIAWEGSWPSIEQYGLLSSKALLRSYGKSQKEIVDLTQKRRSHWVEICAPDRPPATLRDQKPITDKGLLRVLNGSVEPWEWYDLINSMVFFWPTKKRVETMIKAKAYRAIRHDLIVVNTEKLVQLESENIRLSRMNSGCTHWFHPRDRSLFKRFKDYPFSCRLKSAGKAGAVAEICVKDRVEKIAATVVSVIQGNAEEVLTSLSKI